MSQKPDNRTDETEHAQDPSPENSAGSEKSTSGDSGSSTASGDSEHAAETSSKSSMSFQQAAEEKQPGLIREFGEFLLESKAWWLTPIIIVLLLVGLLVALSSSVVAPFIYPIF